MMEVRYYAEQDLTNGQVTELFENLATWASIALQKPMSIVASRHTLVAAHDQIFSLLHDMSKKLRVEHSGTDYTDEGQTVRRHALINLFERCVVNSLGELDFQYCGSQPSSAE
jgi:hypothetical protein